jgi:hypothetical protein
MLILHPREVSFLSLPWKGVTSVVIDRVATRVVAEHGDEGPQVVFADCPEQRVTVRVSMDIADDALAAPGLGVQGTLEFATAPTGVNASRHLVSLVGVVTAVTHELSLKRGAVRTVEFLAVAPTGASDPVTVTDIGGLT